MSRSASSCIWSGSVASVERPRINEDAQFAVEFGCARDSSIISGVLNTVAPHGEAIILGDVVSRDWEF